MGQRHWPFSMRYSIGMYLVMSIWWALCALCVSFSCTPDPHTRAPLLANNVHDPTGSATRNDPGAGSGGGLAMHASKTPKGSHVHPRQTKAMLCVRPHVCSLHVPTKKAMFASSIAAFALSFSVFRLHQALREADDVELLGRLHVPSTSEAKWFHNPSTSHETLIHTNTAAKTLLRGFSPCQMDRIFECLAEDSVAG